MTSVHTSTETFCASFKATVCHPEFQYVLRAEGTVKSDVVDVYVSAEGGSHFGLTPVAERLNLRGNWPSQLNCIVNTSKKLAYKNNPFATHVSNYADIPHGDFSLSIADNGVDCPIFVSPIRQPWFEIAESLSAAAANKILTQRFVSISSRGNRKELILVQECRTRTAALIAMRNGVVLKKAALPIEDYLCARTLIQNFRYCPDPIGDNKGRGPPVELPCLDKTDGTSAKRFTWTSVTRYLSRSGPEKPRYPSGFYFEYRPGGGEYGLISWHRGLHPGDRSAEKNTVLELVRRLQASMAIDLQVPANENLSIPDPFFRLPTPLVLYNPQQK